MRDFLESPLGVATALVVGIGGLFGIIMLGTQISHNNLMECYNTVKDKSTYDIIVLCKGIR